MIAQPTLAPWTRLFASLALEVILVFALVARLVRSASGQRMVWRVSFVAMAALVLAEASGVGHSLLRLRRPPPPESAPARAVVVTTTTISDAPLAPAWAPTAANAPGAPVASSRKELLAAFVAWLPVLALAGLVWFGARRSVATLKLLRLGRRASSDTGGLAARVEVVRS